MGKKINKLIKLRQTQQHTAKVVHMVLFPKLMFVTILGKMMTEIAMFRFTIFRLE